MMKHTDLEIKDSWQSSLDLGFMGLSYNPNESQLKTCHLDAENSGNTDYCIQVSNRLIELNNKSISRNKENTQILPLKQRDGVVVSYLSAEKSRLGLIDHHELKWEIILAPVKFGIGFGRDEEDHFDVDSDYVGSYRAKIAIVGLKTLFGNESSEPLIAVFMSNGMLHLIRMDGTAYAEKRLLKGYFDKATIIDCSEGGSNRMIVSAYRNYKRSKLIDYDIDHEWHSMLLSLKGQKISLVHHAQKTSVIAPIPNQNNNFVDNKLNTVKLISNSLEGSSNRLDFGFDPMENDQLLKDPRDESHLRRLSINSGQNSFSIKNMSNIELWTQHFDVPGAIKSVIGCIGASNTAAEHLTALLIETTNRVQGYAVDNIEYYIRVYQKEGILVKKYDYPKDTDVMSGVVLLLDDIDQNQKAELLVMNQKTLTVFKLDDIAAGEHTQITAHPSDRGFPEYQLPKEDLWSQGIR